MAELQPSIAYELGQTNGGATISLTLYPAYIRAEVFRAAKRGQEAAAEYQKSWITGEL